MAAQADPADERREAAIERLKAKRAFQSNAVAYVVINAFLVGIWAVSGGGFFWPVFVILGWGIGLAMHAWQVYGQKPITEEAVRREMEEGEGT